MAKVIVYDEYTNRLFTYNLSENDPMPYAYGNIDARARVPRLIQQPYALDDDARHGGHGTLRGGVTVRAFTSAMRSSASGKAATERPASTTRA